jgi:hypothetical protein
MYNWSSFINKTKDLLPRELLVKGCKYIKNYNYALDFGAGGLRDTKYLIKFPFKEIDILDSCPDTEQLAGNLNKENLKVYIQRYESFKYPNAKYDLINAEFSLPFISKKSQKDILNSLIKSLTNGGIFVGNFFGLEDSWNDGKHKGISFYSIDQIREILKDLKIIFIEEKKYNKESVVDGVQEKWNVIEFIAMRD